jgi:hypothetical protein
LTASASNVPAKKKSTSVERSNVKSALTKNGNNMYQNRFFKEAQQAQMSALIPTRGAGLNTISFDEYTDLGTHSKVDISEMEFQENMKQSEL